MTDSLYSDLDALPFATDTPATPNVTTKLRHRHSWWLRNVDVNVTPDGAPGVVIGADPVVRCISCGAVKDEARSRRGRTSRVRGGRIQRQRIEGLGGRNLAGNNPNLDGIHPMFRFESKSGGAFPERLWRWLSDIPRDAGQVGVLIVTDAPGSGHRARSVVVVDYDDWQDLHGPKA